MFSLRSVLWAVLLGGCTRFASPWEEATPTDARVEGWVSTTVDAPHPGAGWFRAGELEAVDFGRVSVASVRGASDDVVVVQIGSVQPEGMDVLELDIALAAWESGAIVIDGGAGIGELRERDGRRRLVIGGSIDVRQAGARAGEPVELSFVDLVLAEES